MAQAGVNKEGYFRYIEFPTDAEHYVWIGRKKGQPMIGLYKKTKHGRLGLTLTPEQFQHFLDLADAIQLALSLIAPT